MGSSVSSVCEFYDVGKSTVYVLIKKKDEYYEVYANSDCKHKLKFRKTLHKPRSGEDFDKVLMEWFKLRRSEGLPITGRMIQLQAKKYHS